MVLSRCNQQVFVPVLEALSGVSSAVHHAPLWPVPEHRSHAWAL